MEKTDALKWKDEPTEEHVEVESPTEELPMLGKNSNGLLLFDEEEEDKSVVTIPVNGMAKVEAIERKAFATCFDPNIFADPQENKGKHLRLKPTSAEVVYSEVKEGENIDDKSTDLKKVGSIPSLSLVRKQFSGGYAMSSEEFIGGMVGAKSRNISCLFGLEFVPRFPTIFQ